MNQKKKVKLRMETKIKGIANDQLLKKYSYPLLAIPIGCFRDTGRRAIPTMEGRSRLLKGPYRRRRYSIQKCGVAAERRGYRVFAIQHQGWCASSKFAYRTYGRYGRSKRCRNGKGGPWANTVYVLKGNRNFSASLS